jgi:hypothetical protein
MVHSETGGHRLLATYLNDHLAGATAGTRLARRLASAHRSSPDGPVLLEMAKEIHDDRDTLITLMKQLGVPVNRAKVLAGYVGELVGRWKPNNHLLTRSPLSTLVELEIMRLGVEGKNAGWLTLRTIADTDERLGSGHLDELIARAEHQAQVLESLRIKAVTALFVVTAES